MRFQLDWSEPRGFRRAAGRAQGPRLSGVQVAIVLLVSGGLGMAGGAWIWKSAFPDDPLTPSILLGMGFFVVCVVGLPLYFWLAPSVCPYFVFIGPKGISRSQIIPTGHGAEVNGWTIGWDHIDRLVYVEDFRRGDYLWKVLLVHDSQGQWHVIGVGDEVAQNQLDATLRGWGKRLEMASSAECEFLGADGNGPG
jgi:hypothetical protein